MSRPDAGALAGVAIHTLFRGHPSQLLQWCNFHLGAGAERLYVVLDCPTPQLLEQLPEHPQIDWQVMDQDAWDALYPAGSSNFERKLHDAFRWSARRAAADGFEFLAFIDADELLDLTEPFTEIAGSHPGASAYTIGVREMWFDVERAGAAPEGPFSATLALRKSSPRAINWGKAVGWRAQFLRNGLLGHDAGKSVYRLPLGSGEIGSHRPLGGALAAGAVSVDADSATLLHFDSGSFPIWNQKWGLRLGGETVAVKLGRQRQAQEALFANVLRRPEAEQERFFHEFYGLDAETQQALTDAGVLVRVDVSDRISGPLPIGEGPAGELRRLPPVADRVDFQFALVCDQRFVKPTFATMTNVLSRMGHLGSVRFVVLGDGLRPEDVRRLKALETTAYDVDVRVHDITSDLDRDVGTEDKKRATFGRIYLVDYLPVQRTLYLDGDVLATRPFPELFSMDLGGAALAGVSDSSALRMLADPASVPLQQRNRLNGITGGDPMEYLNGGVLIFDLDNPDFFDLAMGARALVVLQGHALQQRDQDALNLAFAGRKHRLSSRYNYMTQFYVSERTLPGDLAQHKYAHADATLVHFSGKLKPWVGSSDEFYNGLYRKLVVEAEQHVGVSCEFYFSEPVASDRRSWSAERWAAALAAPTPRADASSTSDVALLGICDRGAYLTLSTRMHHLVTSRDLRLALRREGEILAEVGLREAGTPLQHLGARIEYGVRFLPLDLDHALAPLGGDARGVEITIGDPAVPGGYTRSLGVLDVLASGSAATTDLLAAAGIDGALERVSGDWLLGWVRPRKPGAADAVALYADGELVARQVPQARKDGTSGFRFNLGVLPSLGYTGEETLSVRVAASNLPLRGSASVPRDQSREWTYDPATDTWSKGPGPAYQLARRARNKLRRVAAGVRS